MADDLLRIGYTPSFIPQSFDYTSRDYYAIRDHLIEVVKSRIPEWTGEDASDFGLALVEAFAYLGDLVSYYVDRAGNEAFLPTATRRQSVINIARSLGYVPSRAVAASGVAVFSSEPTYTGSAITVPKGTVINASISRENGTVDVVQFTTDSEISVANSGASTQVSITEGYIADTTTTANHGIVLGVSDGSADQEFELPFSPVAHGTLEVFVWDGASTYTLWNEVDHLIEYTAVDNAYETKLMGDGTVVLVFGDGITGRIPPVNQQISAKFRVGGGTRGNVPAGSITNIENSSLDVNLNVTNPQSTSGGADEESTFSIRENASQGFRANRRAVSKNDIEILASNVPGCYEASANAAVWSNISLAIAPNYDGSLNPGINLYEDCDYAWSSDTITVTKTGHGLTAGQAVYLDFTTGGATSKDGTYAVATTPDADTFTVTVTGSGASGKVTASFDVTSFATLKTTVKNTLERLMMMGTSLTVRSPLYPRVKITVSVNLVDTASQTFAKADIARILRDGPLSFERRGFGGDLTMADIISAIVMGTQYVTGVTVDDLFRKDSGNTTGVHATTAAWYEILTLDTAADLTINFNGTGINDQ